MDGLQTYLKGLASLNLLHFRKVRLGTFNFGKIKFIMLEPLALEGVNNRKLANFKEHFDRKRALLKVVLT